MTPTSQLKSPHTCDLTVSMGLDSERGLAGHLWLKGTCEVATKALARAVVASRLHWAEGSISMIAQVDLAMGPPPGVELISTNISHPREGVPRMEATVFYFFLKHMHVTR
ncbi:hypothetical protein H1C71_006944, partial [Ictidomys tridecemlineatus]